MLINIFFSFNTNGTLYLTQQRNEHQNSPSDEILEDETEESGEEVRDADGEGAVLRGYLAAGVLRRSIQ